MLLESLRLDGANLVSDEGFRKLFKSCGSGLKSLKLSWLDNSFDDETVSIMVQQCPNLERLKLWKCFKMTEASMESLAYLSNKLKHLSLELSAPISQESTSELVKALGGGLQTLSLRKFDNADDELLTCIHVQCRRLTKLRLTDNSMCTDQGFIDLFSDWDNPPLSFIDLSSNRDLDNSNPDGPDNPIGLASNGFKALMAHSGKQLERLEIKSCRHISNEAFTEVFDGVKQYPCLKTMDVSFLPSVDTFAVSCLFKSCPNLKKLTAFACFQITGLEVPQGVALVGVPNAQAAIVVEGGFSG